MTQKVLKVGDSAAVTIPKKALLELGISIGDYVSVDVDEKHDKVTITRSKKTKVNQELIDWTDNFIEQYRPALKALAKK